MKKSKHTKALLKHLAAVRGRKRDTLIRPRSAVFQDKTKYNRKRQKQEFKKELNDN